MYVENSNQIMFLFSETTIVDGFDAVMFTPWIKNLRSR